MSGIPNSTIAALCYAKPSNLNFQALVAELEASLRDNPHLDVRVSTQYDDFVVFDLTGLRICLAYCDFRKEFPDLAVFQNYAESLVFAVGSSPQPSDAGTLFERRADMCQGLVDRVEAHHPPDQFLLIELDEVFTEDVYDSVLEKIWPVLQSAASQEGADAAPALETSPLARSARRDPDDVLPELSARYEAELAKREDHGPTIKGADEQAADRLHRLSEFARHFARRQHEPTPKVRPTHPCVAADMAGKRSMDARALRGAADQMDWAERTRLRVALYPPESQMPEPKYAQPLVHRLAIHSMNAAVLAFSLPVGAAVLTYSALGGESMGFTSRAMALAGTLAGVTQSEIGAQVLGAFV